jgi:hypothetical protein
MYVLIAPATLIRALLLGRADTGAPRLVGGYRSNGRVPPCVDGGRAEPRRHPRRDTIRFLPSDVGDFDWHPVSPNWSAILCRPVALS